jgi:hypothetical protein
MSNKTKKLEDLHEKLADKFLEVIEIDDACTPAMLKTMTGFLKDNDITSNMEDDEKTSKLAERLKEKKQSRLASVTPIAQEG